MRLAILQPFYLPYAGVFEQIRLADTFVFYDDVQFVAQNWQTRNRVKTPQGLQWLTVPVRHNFGQPINAVEVNNAKPWGRKHWRTIEQAYAKAPHRDVLEGVLRPILEREWQHLAELNITATLALCDVLGVSAEFLRSSDMDVSGSSSERVLNVCKQLGADAYLSGPSARDYLDEQSFLDAGIDLQYFSFAAAPYHQLHGEFEPNLSVVDLIANEGENSGRIIAGCGTAQSVSNVGVVQ